MKNHYTMITETCSCGGKIEIEHTDFSEAERMLSGWRKGHAHLPRYPYYNYQYYYPNVTWGTSGTVTINSQTNGKPDSDPPTFSMVS